MNAYFDKSLDEQADEYLTVIKRSGGDNAPILTEQGKDTGRAGKSECVCMTTRTCVIPTKGGFTPVFIMELHSDDLREPVVKFFNVKKTPKGNYTVSPHSDFAKLYRLTFGLNPKKRWDRAVRFLKHFHDVRFIVDWKEIETPDKKTYLKATHIQPVDSIVDDGIWTETGTLIKAGRPYANHRKCSISRENTGGRLGEHRGNIGGRLGEDWGKQSASSPNEIAASSHFQSHNTIVKQYHSKAITCQSVVHSVKESASVESNLDEEKPMIKKPQVFVYHQRPDETYDEYLDRVIDESLPDWEDKF
jgi:hypothetical protein